MTTSRRGFLRSLGTGVAAGAAIRWPLPALAGSVPFEPPRAAESGGPIRLDSNENAYGPLPKVAEAIKAAVSSSNRYPRMETRTLRERIAAFHHVKPEQVVLGCGSTEILRMAAIAFLGSGKLLIQAAPTFEAAEHYAQAAGSGVISIHLAPAYDHDLERMLARMSPATTLVYICNPNNPTASLTPRKDLEHFISKLPASTMVLIDEAYHHFAGHPGMYTSFIDHPMDDDRVIVTRTFSKVYGLAGLRLGYAVAAPKLIEQMRRFATETNVNAIVAQAAMAGLDDTDEVNEAIQRNDDDRQEFFNQALARQLKPIDSHANFAMMNTMHPAEELIRHFREHNVLIGRHFPPMDNYIRVSFGRPEEMQAFWQAWDALPFAKEIMVH